jgi:transcriptional regulator with XRE-family HTH domain
MRISGWPSVRKCDDLCGRGPTLMTVMNDDPSQLSDDQSRAVAALIREELARRRISRQRLADQAKISISTLEKALAGRRPFTLTTTIRLEEALGVSLRAPRNDTPAPPAQHNGVARGDLGSYARASVSWIEGRYVTVRPSFSDKDAIYAYQTEIAWNEQRSSLIFRESQRLDAEFTHQGDVSMPNQSGHIYLLVNSNGQYRLIILTRPTRTGLMHGILTTLLAGRGAQLTPVAAPIALIPASAVNPIEFGRISAGHRCYEGYRKTLRRTIEEPFALFLPA